MDIQVFLLAHLLTQILCSGLHYIYILSIIPLYPRFQTHIDTKKAPAFLCKCLIFSKIICSGSQDVSVVTPCLLLILTCSAGACYPRKRHGLNLLWNQICRLSCLAAFTVSVCIPLRASSHGLQPYTDGLRPCRQQKTPQRNLQCRFLVAGRRIELRTS